MRYVELPSPGPPGCLAWEEALLEAVNDGAEEVLWFWESPVPFVVVGYGQRRAVESRLDACAALGIPVLRRCSGGGTVLQGPGCLNYGLALRLDPGGELDTITGTNRAVLSRVARALGPLIGVPVFMEGHTDLTRTGPDGSPRKFSGNAQRRCRNALMVHGTLLIALDLDLLDQVLPAPSWEPTYRAGRTHRDFLINTGLDREAVRAALKAEWGVGQPLDPLPWDRQRQAMADRFGREEWHGRR